MRRRRWQSFATHFIIVMNREHGQVQMFTERHCGGLDKALWDLKLVIEISVACRFKMKRRSLAISHGTMFNFKFACFSCGLHRTASIQPRRRICLEEQHPQASSFFPFAISSPATLLPLIAPTCDNGNAKILQGALPSSCVNSYSSFPFALETIFNISLV